MGQRAFYNWFWSFLTKTCTCVDTSSSSVSPAHLSIASAGRGPPGAGRGVKWGAPAWGTQCSSPHSLSVETACSHPWPGLGETRRMRKTEFTQLQQQHQMLFQRLNLFDFALLREAEAILSDTRGIAYVNLLERGGQVPCWGHVGAINKVLIHTIWRKHTSADTKSSCINN